MNAEEEINNRPNLFYAVDHLKVRVKTLEEARHKNEKDILLLQADEAHIKDQLKDIKDILRTGFGKLNERIDVLEKQNFERLGAERIKNTIFKIIQWGVMVLISVGGIDLILRLLHLK